MFGVDVFGYGGYTPPTITMKRAEWTDLDPVEKPTIYEKCIEASDFADGWNETLSEGENVIAEDKQGFKSISVPEGYVVNLFSPTAEEGDDPISTLTGPQNDSKGCDVEGDLIGTITVTKQQTCADLNRVKEDEAGSDYLCGDCAEGYILDEDEESETYGQCIEEDNTLLYAGIGVVGLILAIAILK